MPLTGQQYVVVYDVTEDHERTRVSKVLEGFGFRVQKSAFECTLSRSGREKLRGRLEELDLQTGFVLLYQIQSKSRRLSVGQSPPILDFDAGAAFIV